MQLEELASRNQFDLILVDNADGDRVNVPFTGGRVFFEVGEAILRFENVLNKDGGLCFG